ncbi:unnamed protein product, partial [Symbiodinium pilosum]
MNCAPACLLLVAAQSYINDLADAGSDADTDLEARPRLYQSITRAQLGAIVVNELLQGGWLEHLTTCRLVEPEFDAATAVVK